MDSTSSIFAVYYMRRAFIFMYYMNPQKAPVSSAKRHNVARSFAWKSGHWIRYILRKITLKERSNSRFDLGLVFSNQSPLEKWPWLSEWSMASIRLTQHTYNHQYDRNATVINVVEIVDICEQKFELFTSIMNFGKYKPFWGPKLNETREKIQRSYFQIADMIWLVCIFNKKLPNLPKHYPGIWRKCRTTQIWVPPKEF